MSESNNGQNVDRPNGISNPPTPSNDSDGAATQRSTRNITVSIQYSYFTPDRFANLNTTNTNGSSTDISNANNSGTGNNTDTPSSTRPDGALVLSFREVPISTPQERLESIISIAAELAMRRFSDMISQPKGITKQQFALLPVLKSSELIGEHQSVCSICYEKYDDEMCKQLKRTRDNEVIAGLDSVKKQRSESPMVASNVGNQGSNEYLQTEEHAEHVPPVSTEDESASYIHSAVKLPCDHIFGRECLYKWSQLENSCPLCRKKIVESTPEQQSASDNGAADTNADAFERIGQLLYNPPTQDEGQVGQPQLSSGGTNIPTNTSRDNSDPQSFTISRSGIVFLRPDSQTNPSALADPVVTPDINTSENLNEFSTPSSLTQNAENVRARNPRRIQWIPVPITSINMSSENNDANASNDASVTNQQGNPQNDRLRTILDHIFNVTHAENTIDLEDASTDSRATTMPPMSPNFIPASSSIPLNASVLPNTSVTSSSTPNASSNDAVPPRRRSFLENILRITNRNRNRPSNTTTQSTNSNVPNFTSLHQQSNTNMFNSGVASYRNQDGHVSTFHIREGPLPFLQTDNEAASNSTSNNNQNEGNSSSQTNDDELPRDNENHSNT